MKKALIFAFLLAAPLHGRLSQHNFSFTLTASLGLLGGVCKNRAAVDSKQSFYQ